MTLADVEALVPALIGRHKIMDQLVVNIGYFNARGLIPSSDLEHMLIHILAVGDEQHYLYETTQARIELERLRYQHYERIQRQNRIEDIKGFKKTGKIRSDVQHSILFDIGGVVVISPFQAILDYEIENKIPNGYINFAIQKGPHDTGAWQLIERGEVELNDDWFAAFKKQLMRPEVWSQYLQKLAQQESVGGGQAIEGGKPQVPDIDAKKLFWRMMKISRAPDPYMYPALRKLGESGKFVLGAFSNNVTFPTGILDDEGKLFTKELIHAPAPNPYANDSTDITTCFDIFLGSAAVGVRKPDPEAYKLAVREMDRIARKKGMGSVTEGDTLFLDDIGINLKFAKKTGLRTIKVNLGKTKDAVKELEEAVGIPLLDGKAKL
ncbi:uncharacterized protein J4E84_004958 [Alternaria hordeiaustralica]|uniref:uncharacterized protein n=1 Tax=Alternaria hordeiaustralica TaxID=1187925 RepID=UPI0020C33BF6|nr:uncharacterized protein J4E84_004958 [Alternaria hordeiaustralica]KAI4688030.1 hypothetical protein J4E84_004958 [Alternaria hordeiaustralica]